MAFAACSNDETIAVNQGDAIVFRPVVDRTTRSATAPADADDNGSTAPTEFNITAWVNDNSSDATHEYSGTPYINNVTYHNNSGTYYVSSSYSTEGNVNEYYWPSNSTGLDFFAYYPISSTYVGDGKQVQKVAYNEFTVTPTVESSSSAKQVDFLFAHNIHATKPSGSAGTPLVFKHTEAKIQLKVYNSSTKMKFDVQGWKIGNVNTTGTLEIKRASNSVVSAGTIALADWTSSSIGNYESHLASGYAKIGTVAQGSAASIDNGKLILIPQSLTALSTAAGYNPGTAIGNPLVSTGAYIAVQLKIRATDIDDVGETRNGTFIAGDTDNYVWAVWPISNTSWEPGKAYTYIIDLADGGYSSTNLDTDADLDPILENAIIKFATVTVTDWDPADGTISVVNP